MSRKNERCGLMFAGALTICLVLSSFSPVHSRPKLAKVFQEPKRHGVHVMNIETGRVRYLGDWLDWHVSPDGKKIAHGVRSEKKNAPFVLYVDSLIPRRRSRKVAQFPFGNEDSRPFVRWQADSRRIKVDGSRDGDRKRMAYLVSINRPGVVTRTSLTQEDDYYSSKPMLSPNGRYRCGFLPRKDRSAQRILVIKDARTGKEIRRLDTKRGAYLPLSWQHPNPWSPDSRRVLFVLRGETEGYPLQNDRLCTFDVATGKVHTLVSKIATINDAIYSPNGQWVAFLAITWKRPTPTKRPWKIYIARSDGKMLKEITFYEKVREDQYFQRFFGDAQIAWLSDSKQIAFYRIRYMDAIV